MAGGGDPLLFSLAYIEKVCILNLLFYMDIIYRGSLSYADLSYADLSNAVLSSAEFWKDSKKFEQCDFYYKVLKLHDF